MSYQSDYENYILAMVYALCPIPGGKYEWGETDEPPLNWSMMAQTQDHTTVYVKYNPEEMPPPWPY